LASQKQVGSTIFFQSKTFDEVKHHVILRPIIHSAGIEGIVGVCKNLIKEQQLQEKITALKGNLLEMNRLLSVERQRSGRKKVILEELNNMKNNFISEFSHEMRTPLSTIIGFSEAICSDDQLSDSMKAEFQAEILREAKRLAKMINETLEHTIVESNKALLAKSNIDCLELLKNVILSNKSLALTKNISLDYDLPDHAVMISADKDRLADVFDALIKNSVKHTQKGGKIKIIGQIFPKEIELLFTDTGKGISHFDSQTLLNPSNTVKIIRKAKSETGIGLDFAKKIVDLHNGYMNIQSEVDRGSTFIIKLPRYLTD
jgi:signal transduction histidine kinase